MSLVLAILNSGEFNMKWTEYILMKHLCKKVYLSIWNRLTKFDYLFDLFFNNILLLKIYYLYRDARLKIKGI